MLGSAGDQLCSPQGFGGAEVVGVDALSPKMAIPGEEVLAILAPVRGETTLKVRAFEPSSSIPELLPGRAEEFGLEEYVRTLRTITAPAVTLAELAEQLGPFDAIKLDIEGLDGPLLMAAPQALAGCLVVQMELRFLPFYEGEPHLDELVLWMRERGFEVVRVDVEHWRYADARGLSRNGRSVFADVIFARRADGLGERERIRMIRCLGMFGQKSYAAHLASALSPEQRSSLLEFLRACKDSPSRWMVPEPWLALGDFVRAARRWLGRHLRPPRFRFEHQGR